MTSQQYIFWKQNEKNEMTKKQPIVLWNKRSTYTQL